MNGIENTQMQMHPKTQIQTHPISMPIVISVFFMFLLTITLRSNSGCPLSSAKTYHYQAQLIEETQRTSLPSRTAWAVHGTPYGGNLQVVQTYLFQWERVPRHKGSSKQA